ncbi:transposase [Burkholderia ambifaria]|nr:transposase [Burkholderia ambifaria]
MELAHGRRRFGYRRLHALVEREGIHANRKRVHRLYREAGLAVRRRRRRHGVMIEREQLVLPSGLKEVWSIEFVMDVPSNGRHLSRSGVKRTLLEAGWLYRRAGQCLLPQQL